MMSALLRRVATYRRAVAMPSAPKAVMETVKKVSRTGSKASQRAAGSLGA